MSRIILNQLTLLGIIALFIACERLVPASPHKPLKGNLLNLGVGLVGTLSGPVTAGAASLLTAASGRALGLGWIDLRVQLHNHHVGLVIVALIGLLLREFFYYWMHRLQHRSRILWQQHKLHHLDEQLNATTAVRQHWLEGFLFGVGVTLPITLLFKLSPAEAGPFGVVLGLAVFAMLVFSHSNIRWHAGAFSKCLNFPQVHRIHHSRLPEHQNKNFCTLFPIVDVIFGTYHAPTPEEFPPSGVPGERDVAGLLDACILPLVEWRCMLDRWRGERAQQRRLTP